MKGEQLLMISELLLNNCCEGEGPQTILAEGPLLVCWLKIFHRIVSAVLKQLGNGNPLQYSCLENPTMEEPSGLQFPGLQRVGHD